MEDVGGEKESSLKADGSLPASEACSPGGFRSIAPPDPELEMKGGMRVDSAQRGLKRSRVESFFGARKRLCFTVGDVLTSCHHLPAPQPHATAHPTPNKPQTRTRRISGTLGRWAEAGVLGAFVTP